MISDLWLIGIGTGSPAHVTLEGVAALRGASVILMPHKGEDTTDLVDLRAEIIAASGTQAEVVAFEYPVRNPELPYEQRVDRWHDEIARRWSKAAGTASQSGPVALLVWGDPSLYDSTLRIAQRLDPAPTVRVVPGITAIQALTAAHGITLNTINGAVTVTTGRRLRRDGWPDGAETIVVMLDGEASFRQLAEDGFYIWWGAYLGSPNQIIIRGPLSDVSGEIVTRRADARARHGWIMDTYLIRRA